jgi:hypothetical protein
MKMILLILTGIFAFNVNVFAQDEVKEQLITIAYLMALEDYEITHDVVYNYLDEYESDTYDLNLSRGYSYKIVAVCDGDCGDIDLNLYDENGNVIAKDTGNDDYPIVEVSPRWTGAFKLKIKMYDCDLEPCKVGVVVFGQ